MKIDAQQKATLLQIMREKPKLISGKFDSNFTHAVAKAEWEAIAVTLNSMPGCQKTWKMWRSTWQHIRSRTKQKHAQVLRNRRATGGGPEDGVLDESDENLLSIIKPVMVEGHAIAEPAVMDILPEKSCNPENINQEPAVMDILPEISCHPENINQGISGEQQPEVESRPIRKILQRPSLKVKKSGEAVDAYKQSLDNKNKIIERYYQQKIAIMERNAESIARMTNAHEKIANSLYDISNNLSMCIENLM